MLRWHGRSSPGFMTNYPLLLLERGYNVMLLLCMYICHAQGTPSGREGVAWRLLVASCITIFCKFCPKYFYICTKYHCISQNTTVVCPNTTVFGQNTSVVANNTTAFAKALEVGPLSRPWLLVSPHPQTPLKKSGSPVRTVMGTCVPQCQRLPTCQFHG